MKLVGKIIKDTKIIRETFVVKTNEKAAYRDLLEDCLITLCRELDIQVPLWLDKNTKEFIHYRKTFFTGDQFLDKVNFDRFEIKTE